MPLYSLLRPLLFRLDPERAHNLVLSLLRLAGALPPVRKALRRLYSLPDPSLRLRTMGLDFPNPVGLAAGYDKDGRAMHGLACLGFGHLELGTTTPLPQPGNPAPRIFRLPEDQAIINQMGFPNAGGQALLARLRKRRPGSVVLGVNLGKGKGTPLETAKQDYLTLMRLLYLYADFLVVNVSSPNTIGLRRLQAREYLESLLKCLVDCRSKLVKNGAPKVPLLLKLAPDLSEQELEDAVGLIVDACLEGVIATNTTVARTSLRSAMRVKEGGLSGAPLQGPSTAMIRSIHRLAGDRLTIIGVGGIMSPSDAREKLDAGASLVQIYTGLVYRGPVLTKQILAALANPD